MLKLWVKTKFFLFYKSSVTHFDKEIQDEVPHNAYLKCYKDQFLYKLKLKQVSIYILTLF